MHDVSAPLGSALEALRLQHPVVHNITNFVVMQTTANALLALGASPVMAHAPQEIEEIVSLSSALVLNIGTLSTEWVSSMLLAAQVAKERSIPVVIDPVGAGASRFRTETALQLLTVCSPCFLRGNASEILALTESTGATRGVDAIHTTEQAKDAALFLAERYGAIVCVSGEKDFLTDGLSSYVVTGGSDWMPRITGMGCTASAFIGAFAAVLPAHPLLAGLSAMACMAAAGTSAHCHSSGPGSFWVHFLDALPVLSRQDLARVGIIKSVV